MKKLLLTLLVFFSLQMKCFANYNVVFTIDNNYWVFTMIVIDSIVKNNTSNSPYTFWVLETDIPDKTKEKMKKIVKSYGQEIKFVRVDTGNIDKGKFVFKKIPRVTNVGMVRILIPEILPKEIDKDVLYLDSDMLVVTDLKDLFDTNLGDKHAGMIINSKQIKEKLYDFKYGYAGSGLILFNMPKWRKDKMSEQMLNYFHENFDSFTCPPSQHDECFPFPDQDLINILLERKIKNLDKKWYNTVYRSSYNTPETECIYHYNSNKKPWLFDYDATEAKKLYHQYWKNSPLSKYRYYFAAKRLYTMYVDRAKSRIKTYKTFLKRIKSIIKGKSNV